MVPTRIFFTSFGVCAVGAALHLAAAEFNTAEDLRDTRQKASYGLGVQAAKTWLNRGADVDWDAYIKGLRDAAGDGELLLSEQEIRDAFQKFQADTQAAYRARIAEEGAKNKELGEEFLAKNKEREGVKTTASGLQYEVIEEGDGPRPKATDRVTVHYTGTLIDGKKFDSSVDRGQPATFPLSGVIKGWTEGLQLMATGSKYRFYIPSELAYGTNAPPSIGPNQVLIFDVELLSIESQPQANRPVTSDIIKVPSREELEKGAQPRVLTQEEVQAEIERARAAREQQEKQGQEKEDEPEQQNGE